MGQRFIALIQRGGREKPVRWLDHPPGPLLNQEGTRQARESRATRCSVQPHFILDMDNNHVHTNP